MPASNAIILKGIVFLTSKNSCQGVCNRKWLHKVKSLSGFYHRALWIQLGRAEPKKRLFEHIFRVGNAAKTYFITDCLKVPLKGP